MSKNTQVLIGISALALAYLWWKSSQASTAAAATNAANAGTGATGAAGSLAVGAGNIATGLTSLVQDLTGS